MLKQQPKRSRENKFYERIEKGRPTGAALFLSTAALGRKRCEQIVHERIEHGVDRCWLQPNKQHNVALERRVLEPELERLLLEPQRA